MFQLTSFPIFFFKTFELTEIQGNVSRGRVRLIRTRLIRSSTLFEVSVKCFPVIFLSFHV